MMNVPGFLRGSDEFSLDVRGDNDSRVGREVGEMRRQGRPLPVGDMKVDMREENIGGERGDWETLGDELRRVVPISRVHHTLSEKLKPVVIN